MTHSRARKYHGDLPPEVQQLIAKHGGNMIAAERAAEISLRTFGKIRAGKRNYTDELKRRVTAALNAGDAPMPNPKTVIPEACPPLLARLVTHLGGKTQTRGFLKVGESLLNKMMAGTAEMTATQIVKTKAELGEPVICAPQAGEQKSQIPAGPAFVPWDGKTRGTLKTRPMNGEKGRKINGIAQPILDLVAKFDGNASSASRALGMGPSSLQNWFKPDFHFTEAKQRKVHAALHGLIPPAGTTMGEEFDKYSLGIAICLVKSIAIDRIADIAEILTAKVVFRKNTGAGWILIYRMADDDLPKFKKLALRDAQEIVCP